MLHKMPCNLESFCLNSSVIEELPLSFGNLSRLRSLDLSSCSRLNRVPSRICGLKSLEILDLDDCSELDQWPDDIGCLSSLEYLFAARTRIRELSSSIIHLRKLRFFQISGLLVYDVASRADDSDDNMTDDIDDSMADDCDDSMADDSDENESLNHDPGFVQVYLELSNCMILKRLPKLQLGGRRADNLTLMEVLSSLSFQDCTPLSNFEDIVKNALRARQIIKVHVVLRYPGCEVPEWFDFRSTRYLINLSPECLKKNIMGFALCVAAPPHYQGYCHLANGHWTVHWACKVISRDGRSFIRDGEFSVRSNYVSVKLPILPFSPLMICNAKEVSFEFTTGDYGQLLLTMCGVHLLYGQYVEEVSESSRVCEDKNNLSLVIAHDNREEIDEPHHKRLKKTPN